MKDNVHLINTFTKCSGLIFIKTSKHFDLHGNIKTN